MKTKPLWKSSIVTNPEAEEAVSELLLKTFREPVCSYTDVETHATTVTSYFSKKPHWALHRPRLIQGLARIRSCGLNTGAGKVSFRKVRREDWAESWKRHFKPIEIASLLLIKPSWSTRVPKKEQAIVILDPGLSFGTGQHPTTSFCLQQLAESRSLNFGFEKTAAGSKSKLKNEEGKLSFLDIGTGSGILAISAAKLGYAPIEAFDFDPESVRVARENAKKNSVSNAIRLHRADLTKLPGRSAKKFDVICANLISTLLVAERNRILARLKPGGVLIVAGILAKEFTEVQRAYEAAGLKLVANRAENEWRSGAFVFR